jgi:hypothetical protein
MSDSHVTESAGTPSPTASQQDQATFDAEGPQRSHMRKLVLWVVVALLVAGLVLAGVFFDPLRHWLAFHTGVLNGGPDHYYNFWSGIGSDLGEATLISAVGIGVYTGVRKVNCHTKGCWRIGHHPLDGTPYILCRHHHPHVPDRGASHEHILEQHRRYNEAQAQAQAQAQTPAVAPH